MIFISNFLRLVKFLFNAYFFHRISVGIVYTLYFILTILIFAISKNPNFYYPNLVFTLITNIVLILLTASSQYLNSTEYTSNYLLGRLILAIIPTNLGVVIIFRWIKKQRENQAVFLDYAGPLFMAIVFSIISMYYTAFLIFALAYGGYGGASLVWFLVTTTTFWSLLGVTYIDLNSRFIKSLKFDPLRKKAIIPKIDTFNKKIIYLIVNLVKKPMTRYILGIIVLIYLFAPILFLV